MHLACILICPLCKALLKLCVWSTSVQLVQSAERLSNVVLSNSFFNTAAGVAYNKTRLWKHFGVPKRTDNFKYQQEYMTKGARAALCYCWCKRQKNRRLLGYLPLFRHYFCRFVRQSVPRKGTKSERGVGFLPVFVVMFILLQKKL